MRTKIIESYGEFVGRRRRHVLLGCILLTGLCGAILPRLEFRTSRSAVSGREIESEKAFDEYGREFGPNAVAVVVEGGSEPERRAFADSLAARLSEDKGLILDVFYKLPLEFFRKRLLGMAPEEELLAVTAALEKETPTFEALSKVRGFPDVLRIVRDRIEKGTKEGRRPQAGEAAGLVVLLRLAEAAKRLIQDPEGAAKALEKLDLTTLATLLDPSGGSRAAPLAHGGYLSSADGSFYVLLVQPRTRSDTARELKHVVAAIRRAIQSAGEGRPGVKASMAGIPVTIVEESESVKHDAPFCSILAVAAIGALAAFAFRRKVAVVLVLTSLLFGILWNFGLTWAIFGGINLITSAVPVILLALGIDFGIHVVIAYEAERASGHSPLQAMGKALVRIGPGLTTGAITSALAFYSICFMEYQGFREFGVTAGNGVLVCLLAMVTALPALLLLTDRRPERIPGSPLASILEELVEEHPDLPSPTSPLRRFWHGACRLATSFPILATAASAAATIYFLHLSRGIEFDYLVDHLLPRDASSLHAQKVLNTDPSLSTEFAILLFRDLESLRAADGRAGALELIGRRDSILNMVPGGTTSSREKLMAQALKLLEPLSLDPGRLLPPDAAEIRKSLLELSEVFLEILDKAVGTGMERSLDGIAKALEDSAAAIDPPPQGWEARFSSAFGDVWAWARDRRAEVGSMLAAGPVREEEIPKEILGRLKSPESGRYVLQLYPTVSLEDRENLRRFVAAAKGVDPAATGYPVVFYESTELIHRGFGMAVIAAAVVIFIALSIDFRKFGIVLLATLPKILGIVWMLGIMRLLGINYNLANQIVIPLIIGVGLAYGIHIIHRFMRLKPEERDITSVLEHTGGAIVLSGLTTMIGFGSLALASHRGLASMGTVLFFGVGAALVASLFVLPNILFLIYKPKR